MKKNNKNDNLPVVKNNKFKTKVRKAIFIVLSSLRIASSITPTTAYAKEKTDIEQPVDKQDRKSGRENFIQEVLVKKINENIVNQLVESRGQEYSLVTGKGEKVKEILIDTLDKIDKNFNMNAKKKGKLALMKEKFKDDIISLVDDLNDIVLTDPKEENEYAEYFRANTPVAAVYFNGDNVISMNERKCSEHIEYTLIHEIAHKKQKSAEDSRLAVNYKYIIAMLREGNSNNKAEYIRDVNKIRGQCNALNTYKKPTMIYNKLAFLIGENEMDEYMTNPRKEDLLSFLSNRLDSKYGEKVGAKLYEYITNISLYVSDYSGYITTRIEALYNEIDKKNKNVEDEMQEKCNDSTLKDILDTNNNVRQMLDRISITDKKGRTEELNKQLEGLEKLTLSCINKDIEKINNKNDAIDYVQIWDYYRNRCTINKGYFKGKEEASFSDNFKEVKDIQKKLYNKCKQYKALNIKDEEIFNKMIESQLYNVNNATVSYNKNRTNLIIADEYIINIFKVKTGKDGDKKYDWIEGYENNKGTVKGIKVLDGKRLDKERE